ncbi:MAG: leucyl aminopeptidase [Pseudomonadota bacterium]
MTTPIAVDVAALDLDAIAEFEGRVVVFADPDASLSQAARRVNRLSKGALERAIASPEFAEMSAGEVMTLSFPGGMTADAVLLVKLPRRADEETLRKAGAAIGALKKHKALVVLAGNLKAVEALALGLALRVYDFADRNTKTAKDEGAVTLAVSKPEAVSLDTVTALVEGVFFTRDLVNEPSNILTTTEFADRLEALKDSGLKIEVLDEPALEKLGMRTLLAVGQGSESTSKVVVMEWQGGGDEAPFALIGKGVVFDTGGISLKPAGGMEDMTMDMGGAGTVAGVMKALALRKAKANVVGLVGLVENMPDGKAQRPGDVVVSMKGDTVEVINTDAEGRLVLADVLWYAQERFSPTGMIDLATLTGAIIIGLGHQMAGVFSNDDALAGAFLAAANAEGEGAWRLPMGPAYDKQLKSRIADMKNVGGRAAGSITAAQFLQRFVKEDCPWIHLDIAGTASVKEGTPFAPKGATGWGVLALNRLIADGYEG